MSHKPGPLQHFSIEVEAWIVEKYKAGSGRNGLARSFKVSSGCIDNVLRRAGLKRAKRSEKPVPPEGGWPLDLSGLKFFSLTVLHECIASGYQSVWRCECVCGNKVDVRRPNLISGNTKACGCMMGKRRNRKAPLQGE